MRKLLGLFLLVILITQVVLLSLRSKTEANSGNKKKVDFLPKGRQLDQVQHMKKSRSVDGSIKGVLPSFMNDDKVVDEDKEEDDDNEYDMEDEEGPEQYEMLNGNKGGDGKDSKDKDKEIYVVTEPGQNQNEDGKLQRGYPVSDNEKKVEENQNEEEKQPEEEKDKENQSDQHDQTDQHDQNDQNDQHDQNDQNEGDDKKEQDQEQNDKNENQEQNDQNQEQNDKNEEEPEIIITEIVSKPKDKFVGKTEKSHKNLKKFKTPRKKLIHGNLKFGKKSASAKSISKSQRGISDVNKQLKNGKINKIKGKLRGKKNDRTIKGEWNIKLSGHWDGQWDDYKSKNKTKAHFDNKHNQLGHKGVNKKFRDHDQTAHLNHHIANLDAKSLFTAPWKIFDLDDEDCDF